MREHINFNTVDAGPWAREHLSLKLNQFGWKSPAIGLLFTPIALFYVLVRGVKMHSLDSTILFCRK
jgi:hypothetical protein